ncbi:hypothetical protein EBT25_09920 [bacterium]|nr:hypothetical protein [bacterium]
MSGFGKDTKKWVLVFLSIFGVSLVSAGVFAASNITLNSGNAVNLGAGTAAVTACQNNATVSTQQTYDSTDQRFELTTITLALNTDNCVGKTLAMAFKTGGGQTYSTTWGITSGGSRTLTWGGTAGTGDTSYSALAPLDTANSNISTIAISAQ